VHHPEGSASLPSFRWAPADRNQGRGGSGDEDLLAVPAEVLADGALAPWRFAFNVLMIELAATTVAKVIRYPCDAVNSGLYPSLSVSC
jgi:hypothetical protein